MIRDLLSHADVSEVERLLDRGFEPQSLTSSQVSSAPVSQQHQERDHLVRRQPLLRSSGAFVRCHGVARRLIGRTAAYVYDHAIYKPPVNGAGTPWHQDEAYGSNGAGWTSVHFWIPLQDVDETSGCMRYVPASHRAGRLLHQADGRVLRHEGEYDGVAHACVMRVGDVVVHHPRTLHSASGNSAYTTRKAWIIHFGPWGRLGKLHPVAVLNRLWRRSLSL